MLAVDRELPYLPLVGRRRDLRHPFEIICHHRLLEEIEDRAIEIFGYPDDLKFHSSMTLFARAADDKALFEKALRKYFGGKPNGLTLERL